MNFEIFGTVVQGYNDRVKDQKILAVLSGYWSGYWSNSKHPKSLQKVIEIVTSEHKTSNKKNVHAGEVDVEAFLEKERLFNERRDSLARQ